MLYGYIVVMTAHIAPGHNRRCQRIAASIHGYVTFADITA